MKLLFNDNWAHPRYNAVATQVVDVTEPELVKQLIDNRHAAPYVPAALAHGAKPDAATEARIAGLEASITALVAVLKAAGTPVPETVAPVVTPPVPDDVAFTSAPTSGPFAQV